MVLRSRYGTLAIAATAVAVACGWFSVGYGSVIHDSMGYYFLTRVIRTGGFARWPTDAWAYGYPLFESLVTGWREWPPEEFRLLVFLAQLGVWVGVSALVGKKLSAISGSRRVGLAAFALSALNPVPLLQTTEPLSDLLSAALILAAVALSWPTPNQSRDGLPRHVPFLCFSAASFAAMVRPANVVVLFALAIVWILRGVVFRDVRSRHAVAAVAGMVPPFLPQLAINSMTFGAFHPLVLKNLYGLQARWGMAALKYATLVVPGRSPLLVYQNPFYRGDSNPMEFFARHPVGYAATLLLHGFALMDRDLPFTYTTAIDPWYRLPLAATNLLLLYLAAAGAVFGYSRLRRLRRIDGPGFVVLSTTIVGAAYLALYLPVEVESRFGVPLQALAAPLIVTGWLGTAGSSGAARRARIAALALAPLAVAAALLLSGWMTLHRINPAPGDRPEAQVERQTLRRMGPQASSGSSER